ncbi:unnamed protein product [Strongylus vulgaris]|uniref:Phosphofurin acidic cluster sorting protein 1/2 C-terminal domain-containing protein n=1 Tax=Strongylus vulgaris TaxID=40348 RepID=A0A3P7KT78_STRVU|nr:unnamed protein product [Strongylus vulgaris]
MAPVEKIASVTEQLTSLLSAYPAASSGCWLCSYSDLPHLSTISVVTVNCPSANAVKQAIGQIVNKILSFCNSNSSNPPMTWVGVIGGDRFIGQCLHHKSSSNWLHYLRFAVIPAPHSLIAKLVEGQDFALDQLCRDMWERWSEISYAEKQSIVDKMNSWLSSGGACLNLPIGEALLQMTERGQEVNTLLVIARDFIPLF